MTKKITGNDPTPRQFVKDMLPDHYDVKETTTGIIRCNSREGIESGVEWADFMNAVKKYFGDSFKEVNHATCTNHVNFTVYYSYTELYNLGYTEDHKYALKNKKHQK
jgi:hypothetical protein